MKRLPTSCLIILELHNHLKLKPATLEQSIHSTGSAFDSVLPTATGLNMALNYQAQLAHYVMQQAEAVR